MANNSMNAQIDGGRPLIRLLLLSSVVLLSACGIRLDPHPATQEIPLYPGARGWKVQPYKSGDLGVINGTAITFQTQDAPTLVQKFYQDKLQQNGWTLSDHAPPGVAFRVLWVDECPLHTVDILLHSGNSGQTAVELQLVTRVCQ